MSEMTIDFRPPSAATLDLLESMKRTNPTFSFTAPTTQQQASKLIYTEMARQAMEFPTPEAKKKVAACGNGTDWIGKDLPGVRKREIYNQTQMLVALEKIDLAATPAEVSSACVEMIESVRKLFTKKRKGVTVTTTYEPVVTGGTPVVPSESPVGDAPF
jgi:hypothetical protein